MNIAITARFRKGQCEVFIPNMNSKQCDATTPDNRLSIRDKDALAHRLISEREFRCGWDYAHDFSVVVSKNVRWVNALF